MNAESGPPIQRTTPGFFDHPIVVAIGWFSSVIGLILTIYFYYAAIQTPELTYYVCPARTAVDQSPGVIAARVMFWNAGTGVIEPSDIISPEGIGIALGLLTHPKIVAAEVTNRSRREVQPQLSIADEGVLIRWNILEKNDGAVIEVRYRGDEEMPIGAWGTVKGQGPVRSIGYPLSIGSLQPPSSYEGLLPGLFAAVTTLIVITLLFRKDPTLRQRLFVGVITAAIAYAVIHWLRTPQLPFIC